MVRKIRFYLTLISVLIRRSQRRIIFGFIAFLLGVFVLRILVPASLPKITAAYQEIRKPVFVEGIVGVPGHPNPLFDSTQTQKDITRLVFRGLTRLDSAGNLKPDLAESFEQISDTEYLFKLRKNIAWHDGRSFSSQDVVYTISLAQDQKYGSVLAANFKDVVVEAPDPLTVKFKLKEPFVPFPFATTVGLIPHHISLEKYRPIGTGPFKVKEVSKDKIILTNKSLNIVFKFFPTFEEAKLALKLGKIHALGGISPQEARSLEQFGNLRLYQKVLPFREAVVFFNTKSSDLAQRNVRKALAYSLDKNKLKPQIAGPEAVLAVNQLPRKALDKSSKDRYQYDLEAAKKNLQIAGYRFEDGCWKKNGNQLSLTITFVDDPELNSLVFFLKESWSSFGVKVDTNLVENKTLYEKIIPERSFQVLVNFQDLAADPDQYPLWHTTQVRDANITGVSSAKLDKLLEDGRKISDQKKREELYELFTVLLADEAPAIFLYYPQYTWAVSKKISGINFSDFAFPADRFNSYQDWKIRGSFLSHGEDEIHR